LGPFKLNLLTSSVKYVGPSIEEQISRGMAALEGSIHIYYYHNYNLYTITTIY